MKDIEFLKMAVNEGNKVEQPYNFGAVVVKDGKIIASEHNHVTEQHNPFLHSEVCAIIAACKVLKTHHIDGAVLYSSHEPCTMCLSCAAWAHIDRIVFAISAKEQDFNYEFKNPDTMNLSKNLVKPIKIEHLILS